MSDLPPADTRAPAHWIPLAAARPAMSPAWRRWVGSRDSLTLRLTEAGAPRPFRVQLLDQRLGTPRRDEARALGVAPSQRAWLREVALCLGECPWVVARSVAPLTGLPEHELAHLGECSLGSWLFRQPDLERGDIEVTSAPAGFHDARGPWGRRSVFRHGGFRVLVQEWFLDAMADDLGLPSR
ncbi:chorismate--pyruvate lyase family protein [Halomonas sp. MA07-2]|uniref:chorismate--pyruvate lyase family protein n=1 Tax=unclassified Halomonas TaxID=2609666 RepID=UPI003EE9AE27